MYKKRTKPIIFSLSTLTIIICLILIKSNSSNEKYNKHQIRNLYYNSYIIYSCDKAGQKIQSDYTSNTTVKKYTYKNLSGAQKSIINYIRYKDYKYFDDYYSRVAIFFFILILDLILLIAWITYCSCFCCHCCLFKQAESESPLIRKILLIISLICYIFLIIFSIVVLGRINSFYKKLNGTACGTLMFFEHVNEGLNTHYPYIKQRWSGIHNIISLLTETLEILNDDLKEISDKLDKLLDSYKNYNVSKKITDIFGTEEELKKLVENIQKLKNDSIGSINFNSTISSLYSAYDDLDDSKISVSGDVYDAYHGHINSYVKGITFFIFIFSLIIGIIGLAFLLLYYFFKYNLLRIIYMVIWNLSMFIAFFALIVGIVYGVFGYITDDAINIMQFVISKDNLNSTKPIIFHKNNYVTNIVDICANGDGQFLKFIQKDQKIKNYISQYEKLELKYEKMINETKKENITDENREILNNIQNFYESLRKKCLELYKSVIEISDLNCQFAQNDKNIIVKQVSKASVKGKILAVYMIIIGFLYAVSSICGILFIHKYRYFDVEKKKSDLDNTKGDLVNQ